MSSDKKSSSHSQKQRRKSGASFIIYHEAPEIVQNGDSTAHFNQHQDPLHSKSSPMEGVLNAGTTPPLQQRPRLSSGSVDGDLHTGSSGKAVGNRKLSRTQSESGVHTGKSVAFALPESDDVFCDLSPASADMAFPVSGEMASLHRPICIEEELYTKVNQLNSLVLLWRKRWKQQKEFSDSLVHQIQYTKQECAAMADNMREAYNEKVKALRKDLTKELKNKHRLQEDNEGITQRLNKITEQTDTERKSWKKRLHQKDEEIVLGLSKQEEARTTIRIIKKELSKVKRENEKLVRHIAKLRTHISEIETDRQEHSSPSDYFSCNGQCEHQMLFELAVERVRFYDDLVSHRKVNIDNRKYVVKTSAEDPLNMSVESAPEQPHSNEEVFNDSQTKCSLTSPSSSKEGKQSVIEDGSHTERDVESLQNECLVNNNNNYCNAKKATLLHLSDASGDVLNGHTDVLLRADRVVPLESSDMVLHEESLDTSTASESAVSGEGDLLAPHLPLRKCVTLDAFPLRKSSSLARSKTWVGSRSDSPSIDSGHCSLSPTSHDADSQLNGQQSRLCTSSPRSVRSGFEGLRERRNGITDTKLDATLQLKLSKPRKSHEFGDLLKKLSFHTGHSEAVDKETVMLSPHGGGKKTGFMNLGVSMLTRKKSNSLKDM